MCWKLGTYALTLVLLSGSYQSAHAQRTFDWRPLATRTADTLAGVPVALGASGERLLSRLQAHGFERPSSSVLAADRWFASHPRAGTVFVAGGVVWRIDHEFAPTGQSGAGSIAELIDALTGMADSATVQPAGKTGFFRLSDCDLLLSQTSSTGLSRRSLTISCGGTHEVEIELNALRDDEYVSITRSTLMPRAQRKALFPERSR
jgi:hypothetical protein